MTINLLSKIPLFTDLPLNELDLLISALDVKEMKDRDILFREGDLGEHFYVCLLYTSPSPRDRTRSRMPSSA